jgi:hypothetical protein
MLALYEAWQELAEGDRETIRAAAPKVAAIIEELVPCAKPDQGGPEDLGQP